MYTSVFDLYTIGHKVDINQLKSELQQHLGDGLVTIIGSGLSSAEGMPGMPDLGNHLKSVVPARASAGDADNWRAIAEAMDSLGLEGALLKYPPSTTLETEIVGATVELILPAEQRVVRDVMSGKKRLGFSRLVKHLLKPTGGLPVVTPNYDRLAELAIEQAGLGVDTMFLGNYCGVLDEEGSRLSFLRDVRLVGRNLRCRYRERALVYKPHGSLDWYQRADGSPFRYAGDLMLPRLIITPGLNKFKNGYQSPFDRHRDRANNAIDKASRYLVLGYGFNDDHLETHLTLMIKSGSPTLLLTKSVSTNARDLIKCSPNLVVSVNWWKSSWHQPSTSEQLTESLLTPPPFVN